MSTIRFWRHCAQVAVIALFCALPLLNQQGFFEIKGSLFAFDIFGLPFADPASAAQAATAGGCAGTWPRVEFYLGAFATLVIAFFCGRIFCGWLCPYGFFSELAHALRKKSNASRGAKSANTIFWAKAALTLLALVAAAIFTYPLITLLSMPGQISLIPYFLGEGIAYGMLFSLFVLPAAAILFEFVTGKRLWCAYICPQSIFLALAAWALPGKVPGLRIGWNVKKCSCGKQSPCAKACSMGINPRRKDGPSRRDCLMCGDCVAACKNYGNALGYSSRNCH